MRVKIEKIGKYTYPDIVVACEEEQFEDEENDSLLNPVVIIEVLSKSTEAYDRGKKFEHYQSLDSLMEYILVSQTPYRVEQYIRQQNKRIWTYTDFHGENDIVTLNAIHCRLVLKDIYTKVNQADVS
jgi:Uma2 family endonuclease